MIATDRTEPVGRLATRIYTALGGDKDARARTFADMVSLDPRTETCGALTRRVVGLASGFGVQVS